MKLNKKTTVLVGLAFLSICAFWQMYDSLVPLILTNHFRLDETWSGAIMAADNVLALFLLPLFGSFSDRVNTRLGKRMPFILLGTAGACILMNLLPWLANHYYAQPTPGYQIAFINAVINLMGAIGGLLYLGAAALLYSKAREPQYTLGYVDGKTPVLDYRLLFGVVSGIMVVSVAILALTIRENRLSRKNEEYEAAHPEENYASVDSQGKEVLPGPVKRSLGFLLVSIALWYIGYNGVTTWFTTYISRVMGEGIGGASTCLLVATGGAIVSYIPIGMVASRIGRRKTILAGAALLAACFFVGFLVTANATAITPPMYLLFVLVGFAWAAINVNSLPMVVEMCQGSQVGKFTGYYYTFSMAAQVVTPIVAGWLLKNVSYKVLFPYAAFFVACSFVTMLFVRHGDNRVEAKRGLEAYDLPD